MIGYMIEQELVNLLPVEVPFATLLTQVEVDPEDPAFQHMTKPIGPVYPKEEAESLAAEKGWTIAPDGDKFRRVVASPRPKRILEIRPLKWLLEKGTIGIAAGGGGIPTMYEPGTRHLFGVEAVIDNDLASGVLARDLNADLLVIATDVPAVIQDWGTDAAREIRQATPDALDALNLPAGSMGPKVRAACASSAGSATRSSKSVKRSTSMTPRPARRSASIPEASVSLKTARKPRSPNATVRYMTASATSEGRRMLMPLRWR